MVRPGTSSGAIATERPSTARRTAIARFATTLHGSSFSIAIRAAISAIQPMLMTPSANSAAISAQQQPTHQAPCSIPIRRAPSRPGRQAVSRNPSGFRHLRRQTSLSGVSW